MDKRHKCIKGEAVVKRRKEKKGGGVDNKTYRHTCTEKERANERERGRETERHSERKGERERDRETERHREILGSLMETIGQNDTWLL